MSEAVEGDPIVAARERVERLSGEINGVNRRITDLEGSIEARRVDGQLAKAVAFAAELCE